MKKIISLFQRNYEGNRLVRDELTPGAEWVAAGEGIATRKIDGTCCMVRGGVLWKRYEVKPGGKPPMNFEAANEINDVTGKQQGWVPVGDGPEDRWHREAMTVMGGWLPDGTYELCGPKIQGNPENFTEHCLYRHGELLLNGVPRDFEGLKSFLSVNDIEGIVWHRGNGEMVKIKGKDFSIKRGAKVVA